MSAIIVHQASELSVLADFDTGYVLDALSSGIVVLDEQLCAIYANAIAQNLLAVHLPRMRGQPLTHFLPRPSRFLCAVRRALRTRVAVDYSLRTDFARWPENADSINVRIVPLRNQMHGAYVLVEMSGRTWARLEE